MSVLPTADLSALMRTCRRLSEAALLPLCARSFVRLDAIPRVTSFYNFLRIDSGPSSRAPLIKALWLDSDVDEDIFFGILRHCHKLRHLRLDWWSEDIESALVFHVIATSLPGLEEFDLSIALTLTVTEADLSKLAPLPLRKLQLTGNMLMCPRALCVLGPLAGTLVELRADEIPYDALRATPGITFPGVKKLCVPFDRTKLFVETLTTVFPGVTHFTLFPYSSLSDGLIYLAAARSLRERNKQQ